MTPRRDEAPPPEGEGGQPMIGCGWMLVGYLILGAVYLAWRWF